MSKLNQPLKIWHLYLIGFLIMLFGTYIIGPDFGGIFVFAGLFLWIVATVKAIKRHLA